MHQKTGRRIMIIIPIIIVLMALIGWIWWGNGALETTHYAVSSSRLPEAFDGYTIAHVSDLHNAQFGEANQDLIQALQSSQPDIIAITGDLVDSRHTDISVAVQFAREAAQIAPVYYVSGNHEARIVEYAQLKKQLLEAGVQVLEDQGVLLERGGSALWLIGLDDPDFHLGESTDGRLKKLLHQGLYTVLLCHRPELMEVYAQNHVDLALSGHAHGGQIRLPVVGGLIAPDQGFLPKYTEDIYQMGDTAMEVSRGLGNSLFPFRVNNRPQLAVLTLQTAEPTDKPQS